MIEFSRKKFVSRLSVSLFGIAVLASVLLNGCTDTLTGEKTPNQAPLVEFVNIPPDNEPFSRNPEVYWFGSDRDGLIDYYRYFVISVDSLKIDDSTYIPPLVFADTLNDTMWVQITIDQNEADPQTTQIIPLRADLDNPVNNYVPQYIFLQAFDNLGAGSEIVYKVLNRNDNPPSTRVYHIADDKVFVNSVLEGGIITGVRLQWEGTDKKDYEDLGLTAPPFDFEWKLFGPYSNETLDTIRSNFVENVFVSEDARIFHLNDTLVTCDTTISGTVEVSCDTLIFDTTYFAQADNTSFLTRDSILNYQDDPVHFTDDFLVTTSWNGIDTWVQSTSDTIFDVYRKYPLDTTAQMNFIFWIRCRDDAFVADLTPQFVDFPVIEPRYERDIAVLDFSRYENVSGTIGPYFSASDPSYPTNGDSSRAFWDNVIRNWAENSSEINIGDLQFSTQYFAPGEAEDRFVDNTGIDYIRPTLYGAGNIPLSILLKHKVLILYCDNFRGPGFTDKAKVRYPNILSAMDAGISAWATWRNPGTGSLQDNPGFFTLPADMATYFGVEGVAYTNWFLTLAATGMRIEDFKGTYSIDENEWPALDVDPNLLHNRYYWRNSPDPQLWIDSIASLPEASWAERSFGTEVMYLYKSLYGPNHPLGALFRYEGAPVGHRLSTNVFRSVHFTFTLPSIDTTQVHPLTNSVLDWLYDPDLGTGAKSQSIENHYPNAKVHISIDDARARFDKRVEEQEVGGM